MKHDPVTVAALPVFAKGGQLAQTFRKYRWFSLFVLLPLLVITVYYAFIASDQFVSESRFVIKSPAQRPAQISTLANLIQTTGLSAGHEQTNEVIDFIRSRNALAELLKQMDLHAKVSSPDIDFMSRFPGPFAKDKFETLYKFFGKLVNTRFDSETGTAVLTVRAFSAQDAHDVNLALLNLSEQLVNRLNVRARERSIQEAEGRVRDAELRVRAARVALGQFRNAQQLIDPAKQAGGVLEIANRLEAERAALQARLATTERIAPANPAIPVLRGQIAAIDQEISKQNARVAGPSSGIASKLGNYESLAVEQEFATEMLTAASASLEQARSEAARQQFYLERVVEPNTPDLSLYPARLRAVIVAGGTLLCLYFIGWMFVVGILEHAPDE